MIPTIPPSFIRLVDGAYPIPAWHNPDPATHAEVFMDDPPEVPPGFVAELAEQPDAEHILRYTLRPFTLEERRYQAQALIDSIVSATQQRLDQFAQTRGYDGILSAATYATSVVPKFAAEGQYAVTARDATWARLYEILAEVESGTRPAPTGYADIESDLPTLEWPA